MSAVDWNMHRVKLHSCLNRWNLLYRGTVGRSTRFSDHLSVIKRHPGRNMSKIEERASMQHSDYSPGPPESVGAATKARRTPYYGYVIVALAFLIMVIQWGVIYSFGVYFKPMIAEFGWTRAMTSGAFSIAFILSGLVVVYMGWLNDRLGPRFVMSLCGLLLGTGCLLLSRTDSLWRFYLYYGVVIGLAMGGNFIPLISTVARWFAANRGLMTRHRGLGRRRGCLGRPCHLQ